MKHEPITLMSCPFCSSDDLHEYSPDGISIDQSAIRCNACFAVGPVKDQVGDWTRPHLAWNRRTQALYPLGLTLRDWFAAQAMGIAIGEIYCEQTGTYADAAFKAYEFSDAMLAVRAPA